MKVLLIAPTSHYNHHYPSFVSSVLFPSGFGYLASSLREAGHKVVGLNPNNIVGYPSAKAMIKDKISQVLKEKDFDLIGLGGLCTDYAFIRDSVGIIRDIAPHISIVIGGGIVTHDAEYIFNLLKPDFCVIGEGEEAIVRIANRDAYDSIPNIGYWEDGNAKFTRQDFNYKDINLLPFPDYESFNMQDMMGDYILTARWAYRYINPYPKPWIIHTARSCPFSCLPIGTLILRSDMCQIPIEQVKVGDEVIGVKKLNQWQYANGKVTRIFNRRAVVYRIKTEDGDTNSTLEHPWLMHDGFISLSDIEKSLHRGGSVSSGRHSIRRLCTPIESKSETEDYKWGYLSGAIKGDGCFWTTHRTNGTSPKVYNHRQFRIVGDYEMLDRCLLYGQELGIPFRNQRFNGGKLYKCNRSVTIQQYKEVEQLENSIKEYPNTKEFIRGFMAGIYDAEGSFSGSLRISQKDGETKDLIEKLWISSGYKIQREKAALRLLGGLSEIIKFFSWCTPVVTHKHRLTPGRVNHSSRILSYEFIGEQEVYNLETTLGSFIADGFVSHNCSFCVHNKGPKYRVRSIENVIQEIKVFYDRYHFNILIILDELFAVNKIRMKEFYTALLKARKKYSWDFKWSFFTHPSASLSEDDLRMAKDAGCFFFSYGMESASPKVLKSMNKRTKLPQIVEGIELAQKVKLGFGGNFIFGDPAETEETICETLDFAVKHCQDIDLAINAIRPYPGSKLFDDCVANGIIKDKFDYYEHIDERPWDFAYNMTSMPDKSWLPMLDSIVAFGQLYSWQKSTVPYRYEIDTESANSPVVLNTGKQVYKIWAKCPHCGEEIYCRGLLMLDRHSTANGNVAIKDIGLIKDAIIKAIRLLNVYYFSFRHPIYKRLKSLVRNNSNLLWQSFFSTTFFGTGCPSCGKAVKIAIPIPFTVKSFSIAEIKRRLNLSEQ
jgi:radical SAM superfamily enzyme YgiQ (UPF0313 family)